MLRFDPDWRFSSPGPIDPRVVDGFMRLVGQVAAQGNRQVFMEHFKNFFANAGGVPSHRSSNANWAESDLKDYMNAATENAPLFIEAFYDACGSLAANNPGISVPDVVFMNRVLIEFGVPFEIRPPDLVANEQLVVAVQHRSPSLDEQAQQVIQQSLKESERLLAEGRHRPAVQEILWLRETVATAFQGIEIGGETVQGKYFNKIAQDLRRHLRGQTLDQVLGWVVTLHGFLSSPTGGGVRHGANLKNRRLTEFLGPSAKS